MIVEYIRYDLTSQAGSDLESAVGAAGAALSRAAGCRGWELAKAVDREDVYQLRVEWESLDAVEGFKQTAGFEAVLTALGPFQTETGPVVLCRPVAASVQPEHAAEPL